MSVIERIAVLSQTALAANGGARKMNKRMRSAPRSMLTAVSPRGAQSRKNMNPIMRLKGPGGSDARSGRETW